MALKSEIPVLLILPGVLQQCLVNCQYLLKNLFIRSKIFRSFLN